jgi:tRNA dimethylallyltransferase
MRLAGKPLIVLVGPTASGKTRLAILLANALNGEIIGADSRQIYRHMDIGTAKPTAEEQQQARHHLIDVVDPDENLGLAEYQALALTAIHDIHARDRVPLLVGGTGQYITALVEGWSIPQVAPNLALRAELEAFAAQQGTPALHARLSALDPTAAATIDGRNIRRVVRALEVCLESGQPISELQRKRPPPFEMRHYGLTLEREALYARADQRVDAMLEAGFLDEVRSLLEQGYDRRLPSMSGLGYAQLAAHLLDGIPLAEAVLKTKHDTHDFIRRQYTWFRGHDPGILWHNSTDTGEESQPIVMDALRWMREIS